MILLASRAQVSFLRRHSASHRSCTASRRVTSVLLLCHLLRWVKTTVSYRAANESNGL